MNSSSDLLTSIKFKKYSSNSLTTVLNEIPAFQATNHISISCFVSAVEESVQIWYHIHNFRTFFRTSWQPNIQIPSRTTTQCSTSLTALFVHTTETETSHVFNYKQYIIHTLILDTGFEFAGHTDPFSGDDADELSESAPLFEVSFIFLTWEVDGKEILNSLEFLNKTWQEGKAKKSTIYIMLQNRETQCNTEFHKYGYTNIIHMMYTDHTISLYRFQCIKSTILNIPL